MEYAGISRCTAGGSPYCLVWDQACFNVGSGLGTVRSCNFVPLLCCAWSRVEYVLPHGEAAVPCWDHLVFDTNLLSKIIRNQDGEAFGPLSFAFQLFVMAQPQYQMKKRFLHTVAVLLVACLVRSSVMAALSRSSLFNRREPLL